MDIWEAVRAERLDLVGRLAHLEPAQWDTTSLCTQWRIRDVLGHVTAGAQGAYGVGPLLSGMIRHGFNFNRWMADDGRQRGAQDPPTTLETLRTSADLRHKPPGAPPVSVLADTVIHGQDMFRPLGVERRVPESHLRPVADFMKTSFGFGARKRMAGLRLTATDMDWIHGEGPEVTGPAEAFVLVMAGRFAGLSDLDGEGKRILADRCQGEAAGRRAGKQPGP
ncbi:MAG: maleylpyruvate isomerase family mycothiol-dependent enzyme [Acidimicrobiales bacterium]